MGLAEWREVIGMLVAKGLSQHRACGHLMLSRSSVRYQARPESELDVRLRQELRRLAQRRRRLGSPMMTALVRDLGYPVNHKHVERLWREEKLTLPRRRRRRRKGTPPEERPHPATAPNEVWAYDFVHDRTEYGHRVKILVLIDEFTREPLEIFAAWRLTGLSVLEILEQISEERGLPRYIRSDNGSEFRNKVLVEWLRQRGVTPIYIEPGCPWENGVVESFNSRLRDECLNEELFYSRAECQVVLDWYREDYNCRRPHSSLNYTTPAEFAERFLANRQN